MSLNLFSHCTPGEEGNWSGIIVAWWYFTSLIVLEEKFQTNLATSITKGQGRPTDSQRNAATTSTNAATSAQGWSSKLSSVPDTKTVYRFTIWFYSHLPKMLKSVSCLRLVYQLVVSRICSSTYLPTRTQKKPKLNPKHHAQHPDRHWGELH